MLPPWFSLLLVLLLFGIILVAGLIHLIARSILCPPRMTDAKAMYTLRRLSPGDLGLAFEDQPFSIHDSSRPGQRMHMASWWIPAPQRSDRCVLLLHGYADAKVGAIAWASMLHEMNLNLLAVDLRAHGDSGGVYATAGFFEREDLQQLINQLRAARPNETTQLVLFGLSSGGLSAAAVAAARDDLAGIVLDSPLASLPRTLAAHARRMGLPSGWMLSIALRWAQLISGADFSAVAPTLLLRQVRCPMLLIVPQDDELVQPVDVQELQAAVSNPAIASDATRQLVVVPAARHLMSMSTDPAGYTALVQQFLESCLATASHL